LFVGDAQQKIRVLSLSSSVHGGYRIAAKSSRKQAKKKGDSSMLSPYFAPSAEGIIFLIRFGSQRPGQSRACSTPERILFLFRPAIPGRFPSSARGHPDAPEHIILMGAALHCPIM